MSWGCFTERGGPQKGWYFGFPPLSGALIVRMFHISVFVRLHFCCFSPCVCSMPGVDPHVLHILSLSLSFSLYTIYICKCRIWRCRPFRFPNLHVEFIVVMALRESGKYPSIAVNGLLSSRLYPTHAGLRGLPTMSRVSLQAWRETSSSGGKLWGLEGLGRKCDPPPKKARIIHSAAPSRSLERKRAQRAREKSTNKRKEIPHPDLLCPCVLGFPSFVQDSDSTPQPQCLMIFHLILG